MDVNKWQNPYETLIGEPLYTQGREFKEEDYIKAEVKRSKGKRLVNWFSDSATNTLERSERRTQSLKSHQQNEALKKPQTMAAKMWAEKEREKKKRLE